MFVAFVVSKIVLFAATGTVIAWVPLSWMLIIAMSKKCHMQWLLLQAPDDHFLRTNIASHSRICKVP